MTISPTAMLPSQRSAALSTIQAATADRVVVIAVSGLDEHGGARPESLTDRIVAQVAVDVRPHLRHEEALVPDPASRRVILHLRGGGRAEFRERLRSMISSTEHRLEFADGTSHHLEIGYGTSEVVGGAVEIATTAATEAAHDALRQRDRLAVAAESRTTARRANGWRQAVHVALSLLIALIGPFVALVLLFQVGIDLGPAVYWTTVVVLAAMAVLIWSESLRSLQPPPLPALPVGPAPKASAIVAAFLPNEADTIVETLHHFLVGQQYPGELEIVLAYNTPRPLPVEQELAALARRHPELRLLKVEQSTSKAQNVNAALGVVTGEFTGIFDADHHPMPGAFTRAWQWIADGADAVQGHCVIRNGDASIVARTVAVEFEQIYAVSHPGRASLHGFGIFGGSNGFWRTEVLRSVRMRGRALTEDIDASIRATLQGRRIVSDPGLISRELAPETAKALWRQRSRWAQGWFEVSVRQLMPALRSPELGLRQKIGMFLLLGWREIFPWISSLMIPVLAYMAWRDGGLTWSSPLFLMTTLYTISCGPSQILFAWRLAVPELRRRRWWFVSYALVSVIFYTEAKNLLARVAQLKHLSGERQWAVTPRTAGTRAVVDAEVAA